MKFPKGIPIIENVKIQFVNFDNILNQAKKAREGRLNGYLQIIYPQEVDVLFFENGNAINAGRFNRSGFSEIPIKDLVDRAKKSEVGIVNIYDIPDELVYMMIVTIREKPMIASKPFKDVDADKLLSKLQEINFNGFILLVKDFEYFYIKFENGLPVRIYTPGKIEVGKLTPELIKKFFEKLTPDFKISIYKGETHIKQADPALVSLYVKFLNSLISSFGEIIGISIVRKTILSSFELMKTQYSFLSGFEIDENTVIKEGNVAVTEDELTTAMASLIDKFVDAIFVVLGRQTDEVIYKCIKDYRFALKSAGFFEKSKLSRLNI